jgi:hypothetical protein
MADAFRLDGQVHDGNTPPHQLLLVSPASAWCFRDYSRFLSQHMNVCRELPVSDRLLLGHSGAAAREAGRLSWRPLTALGDAFQRLSAFNSRECSARRVALARGARHRTPVFLLSRRAAEIALRGCPDFAQRCARRYGGSSSKFTSRQIYVTARTRRKALRACADRGGRHAGGGRFAKLGRRSRVYNRPPIPHSRQASSATTIYSEARSCRASRPRSGAARTSCARSTRGRRAGRRRDRRRSRGAPAARCG